MRINIIGLDEPPKELLLMGNEAIARGAIEAGVKVCTAYPGTPSTDIIENLSKVARDYDIYVEWSVNEKVALEVAASAAFSGLRAICAMKQNGLNVASDFLLNLNLVGVKSGLVLITCNDPSCHSSTNEQDSRSFAKIADLPLLEPATFQESKEMVKFAFTVSEEIGNVCLLRGVTRTSHARGNVILGTLPEVKVKAYFDKDKPRLPHPVIQKHNLLHENLGRLENIFCKSPFNYYEGPGKPKIIIITCGSGWLYSQEAIELMRLEDSVGILKIGTTWPLPTKIILENMEKTDKFLFVEEVDPFLEGNVKEIAADFSMQIGPKSFYGKKSQHIPFSGETNTDRIISALSQILDLPYEVRDKQYEKRAIEEVKSLVPKRVLGFCPGCPHRASYWSIKNALQLDGRNGFLIADIGCYALSRTSAGYNLAKAEAAMGSGIGLGSGFGKLERFGLEQPVIAVCGDSTFFHAAMPALVNSYHNKSNVIMVILDNSATAMTGFQPHPGVGRNAMGESETPVDIESVCRAIGAKVEVTDPFDLIPTKQKLMKMLKESDGTRVLIMRRRCALLKPENGASAYKVHVNLEKCKGEDCGCNRYCTRIFKCPGLLWDKKILKARID
jgi:indolepyruvate ferredoxin oxidoreductase alpha subunit